jgi:2-methylcitrate dehydratase PrpD
MSELHTNPVPLTQAYAEFIVGSHDLSPRAIEVTVLGFTDALGVTLAGAHEPAVLALARWVQEQGGPQAARVVGQTWRVPPAVAAMLNATAAHALDYDDFAFSNHPSAVLVPAILAAADTAQADGAALMRAYAVGYEVWSDAFLREKDLYYDQGWHPTAVLGTLGATAAACVIWRMSAEQTRHALALAASSAGGVFENFGTMAKPFHGGRAAWVGLQAAGMARCGLQASATAIEGRHGLLRAFSPQGRVDLQSPAPVSGQWRLAQLGLNIKKYPVVGSAQRGIDASLGLRREHAPDVARIVRIDAHISQRHAAVMPHHRPTDALQAKFSLEFAIASALVHGAVGLAQLRDEVVRDPRIVRLMSLVQIHTTEEFEPGWRDAAPFDQIFVHLVDGRTLASPKVRRATGHADTPLPAEQLHEKFMGCAQAAGVAKSAAQGLFEQVQRLPELKDARDLRLPEFGAATA